MSRLRVLLLAALLSLFQGNHAARILALMPFSGKSHYINIQPIMQALAERGHEVTVVTAFAEKNPPKNYRQIIVDNRPMWEAFGPKHDKFQFENMPFYREMIMLWDGCYYTAEVAFNSTSMQEFIKNDNSHFDLVFIELFFQEALYMFAHKYKAPVVAMSTMGFTQYVGDFMGNPLQLSYMPHEFLKTRGRLNLWNRLTNVYYTLYDLLGRRLYVLPRHEALAERHFKNLPKPWPSLAEIQNNISAVLLNTHFTIDTVRPQIPGIIEVGGVHIKETKELPNDLKKFIDESPSGVIFFSLGSNLNSKDMPRHKVDMFLNAFKGLKQRILWKWEDEEMPNKPDNVMIKKWLPQNDILAHPNVVLFITHGGLLSTLEAIHFGKPVIGIPVYGDQHLNAARAESMGFGIKLAFSSLTQEKITESLNEILTNPGYSQRAAEYADRFRDRPMSPLDNAVFWIEYVIRHKGANFMKSPLLALRWYEAYMVDAALLALLAFVVPILLLKKLLGKKSGSHNREQKVKKKKN